MPRPSRLCAVAVLLAPAVWASPPAPPRPADSLSAMRVAEGLRVDLVAHEPLVRQPVAIEFDDRGRPWVIQYLQYPNPAGLVRVAVDRYSRTTYDRVPEPPPRGPRGADRITILHDDDGDGHYDRGTDFAEGLNLATGLAFGDGGVYVLNVPYLLFYPDHDRDDVPDADPRVILEGFGMEDAHSVANSLAWGPDGWLYGCQGSTVTARVRGVEFQQGVWRYHPPSDTFELFCEGGGNAWGLDFDARGELLYSTNHGGHVLVHGLQGASYVKAFAKHGALHNPHAYGWFDHAPHAGFRGGHVTVGGIVERGPSLPPRFRGGYVAADLLGHALRWHEIVPTGPTVATRDGGVLLESEDPWFAPSDVVVAPDGALVVADWCDARTAHPDPDADWHRDSGRLWRVAAEGARPAVPGDATTATPERLLADHGGSQWNVRRARRELARRHRSAPGSVAALLPTLRDKALDGRAGGAAGDDVAALEALWTLHCLEGLDEETALGLLDSPHAAVRGWTVRLLGDRGRLSERVAVRLDRLAEEEPDLRVRCQLACTAARLPAAQALPIVNAHVLRGADADDAWMPLLWWWAVERHAVSGREEVLRRFLRPTAWASPLARRHLLPRLLRRYAAEAGRAGEEAVLRLVDSAPGGEARRAAWEAVAAGLADRLPHEPLDPNGPLGRAVAAAWDDGAAPPPTALAVRVGHPPALGATRACAADAGAPAGERAEAWRLLGAAGDRASLGPALEAATADGDPVVRRAALACLAAFDDPRIPPALVARHASEPDASLRAAIRGLLLARPSGARAWLGAVDAGAIPAASTDAEELRGVALHGDPALDALVLRHWGRFGPATPEERLADIRRLSNDLRAAPGDAAAGAVLFARHCASCHRLFGEGGGPGPDLTHANRSDDGFLLASLVDPSVTIRREYLSVVVHTVDGRVLAGIPERSDASGLRLRDARNGIVEIPTADVAEVRESPVSLMPADLWRLFDPGQLRDLFAYLRRKE